MRPQYSKPVRVSSQMVEKNIQFQRDLDVRRAQLEAFSKENANLVSSANAQTKIELQRRLAHQRACSNELQYEENIRARENQRKLRDMTLSQNERLATELDRDAADEERRRREIQKICEDSPELKELEGMLKIAYLNKERAVQHDEKVYLARKEQERIHAIEVQMEADRIAALRAEEEKYKNSQSYIGEQRAGVQRQIEEKERQRALERLQIEEERKMVDAIVNKINIEDETEYMRRKEKQQQTAEMMQHYAEQRRRELEAQRAAERAEEERIAEFNRMVYSRDEGVAAKKQAKRDEEDRILAQIVEETERKRKEEEEFNALRDLLWEEELEMKRNQEASNRANKQYQMRREMMDANSEMMEAKRVMRERLAEEEARMVAAMRRKFAEDDEKERAAEEARRQSKLHHMTLVERQKEARRAMYEDEKRREYELAAEAAKKEEYRKRVIQEARKRLLAEHAEKLAGFMPRKMFDNEEEYAMVASRTGGR